MKKIPLVEKVKLSAGQGNWHFFENDHIDGKVIRVADGPHGVRVYKEDDSIGDFSKQSHLKPATLFPSASAMASTWNQTLLEEVGNTIGRECRYHQVDVLLGPGINLKRSPLGGRNFEYYSEDPYLTAQIGGAFVKGIQSQHVGACIKHYALNEQETMRRFVDVKIDERTLHELYLYPFYKIIKESNPWMIMSSYNQVNGAYASESSYLLKRILRDQWGYDGVVISDWGAVQDKVKSIKAGMNIEMPGPSSFEESTLKALEEGTLKESELDESLKPLFRLHEKTKKQPSLDKIDLDNHHKIAQKVAKEAIVLLENDGILPLSDKKQSIGVIGTFAKKPRINGGGSATVRPYHQEIPLDALKKIFKHIAFAPGYIENDTTDNLKEEAGEVAKNSDTILFFTGTTEVIETEGKDRTHIKLPKGHMELFETVCKINKNIIVILSNGSALDLRELKKHSRAMLETWFLGSAAADAIVEVLLGKTNPSGRLQETFPLKLEHTPHHPTFPQLTEVDYNQDLIMNGYRYYDTHEHEVLYPFGYGLSYANTTYQHVNFDIDQTNHEAIVKILVELKNQSDIDTHETVQIYLSSHIEHLIKPKKELKAFEKTFIKAQETKTIAINIPLEAFETYDVRQKTFVVYNGEYTLHVARDSQTIIQSKTVAITHQQNYTKALTLDYPINFLKLFHPEWFDFIEANFRPLRWYEKEEPIWRILNRYKRKKPLSDEAFKTLKNQIKTAIE